MPHLTRIVFSDQQVTFPTSSTRKCAQSPWPPVLHGPTDRAPFKAPPGSESSPSLRTRFPVNLQAGHSLGRIGPPDHLCGRVLKRKRAPPSDLRADEEGLGDAWALVVLGERYAPPALVVLAS